MSALDRWAATGVVAMASLFFLGVPARAYVVTADAPGETAAEFFIGFTATGTCTNGGTVDANGWNWSTPNADVSGSPLGMTDREFFSWSLPGTKTVSVTNTGCPSDPPAVTTVEINGCEIAQGSVIIDEGAGTGSFEVIRVNGNVDNLLCDVFAVSGTATAGMVGDFDLTTFFADFDDGEDLPISIGFFIDDDSQFEGDESGSFEVETPVGSKPSARSSLTVAERSALRSSSLLRRRGGSLLPKLVSDTATLVITDNDGEISISGGSVNETDSGTVALTFDITSFDTNTSTPATPATTNVTVEFSTADLSAMAGSDYVAVSGQLVTFMPSGSSVQQVTVDVLGDTLFEGTESLLGTLANAVGAAISTASDSGAIFDNDPAPTVTVSPASVAEGDSGTTVLSFPFSFSGAAGFDTFADLDTADQTATAGSDYVAINGSIPIPAGTTSGTFDVTINGDTVNEGDETFLLDVGIEDFGAFFTTVTGTILNDDVPAFTVDDPTVVEGDSGTATLTYTVSLTLPASQTVSVDVATSPGTASSGTDFVALPTQTLSFFQGQTSMTVDVTVLADALVEPDETVNLNLTNNTTGFPILDAQGVGSIVNDDSSFSFGGAGAASEGGGVLQVQLNRNGSTSLLTTIDLSVSGTATPGSDFDPSGIPSSVVFNPGDSVVSFDIPLIDDSDEEGDETIVITANLGSKPPPSPKPETKTSAAISGLPVTATLTLVDNESATAASVSFEDPSYVGFEDAGELVVVLERSGDTSFPVSVDVVAIDGDATAGDDYVFPQQTVTWAANDGAAREITVELVADMLNEGDEDFSLELRRPRSSSGPVALGQNDRATVTIRERDFVQFSARSYVGLEGGAPVTIELERVGSTASAYAVEVCVVGGTATPADFSLSPISFTWPANDSAPRSMQLRIVDDALVESLETVEIELCNPSVNTNISGNAVTLVGLLDNDIARGPERPVTIRNAPEGPIVLYGPSGQRLVVWQELDGDGFGIFARLYDPSGVPVGDAFRVNRSPTGNQLSPAAAFDGDGNFIVVWRVLVGDAILQPDGRIAMARLASSNLVGGFFDPTGTSQTETVISTGDEDDSQNPDVAADKNGNAVVTWEDDGDVKGRIVDQRGTPVTPAIVLSRIPSSGNPQIAVSASGDFVVIWEEGAGALGANVGARIAGSALVGQVFTEFGQPKTGTVEVTEGQESAFSPAVAADDEGNFIVVWEEETPDDLDIFGRLFTNGGEARTPRFRVNDGTTGSQTRPRVDANSVGDFAIVWESAPTATPAASSASNGSLVGRFFSPTGDAQTGDVSVASTENGSQPLAPDVSIDDDDETTVVFERRGPGGMPEGVFETTLSPKIAPFVCTSDATGVCLNSERFRVTARWQDFEGTNGDGRAVALTSDTGYFWFFDEDNVEVVIKVLDGCAVNDHYWVFAAGLTNTEVNLQVDDSVGGRSKSYFNRLGKDFTPVLDTSAFATCDVAGRPDETAAQSLERLSSELLSAQRAAVDLGLATKTADSEALACNSGPTSLCLNQSRFEAAVRWQTSQGTSGDGQAVPLTSDTGYFWFFDEQNVELVIKVLDACDVFDRYWVFAAGLTDVAAQLSVVDSDTGASRTYDNPLGTAFTPVVDTDAFLCQ